jgi:hypothetical protein
MHEAVPVLLLEPCLAAALWFLNGHKVLAEMVVQETKGFRLSINID